MPALRPRSPVVRPAALLLAVAMLVGSGRAESETDEFGTLNPEELTIEAHRQKLSQEKGVDINTCRLGYPMAKMGDKALAERIFERCAKSGVDGAFPWLSWLAENGIEGRRDLERAAEWDRRSAERGYSVGQLNHGLNLLRGHGVARDEAAGRALIDEAARQGDRHARTVIEHGYDPYSVLPYLQGPRLY